MTFCDPLAELQAQRELHNERHLMFGGPCRYPEHCETARWIALCDRLAKPSSAVVAELEQRLAGAGKTRAAMLKKAAEAADTYEGDLNRLKARLDAAERQRDKAAAALERIRDLPGADDTGGMTWMAGMIAAAALESPPATEAQG